MYIWNRPWPFIYEHHKRVPMSLSVTLDEIATLVWISYWAHRFVARWITYSCVYFYLWPLRFVAVWVCVRSGLWPFRFVAVSVCGRFGLWPFRSVAVSVCGRFGLWPFRCVAVPVCGRSGLWPFRFVAVFMVFMNIHKKKSAQSRKLTSIRAVGHISIECIEYHMIWYEFKCIWSGPVCESTRNVFDSFLDK